MKENNPFARIDKIEEKAEAKKFIEKATGDTIEVKKEGRRTKVKSIVIDYSLNERLEKYIEQEGRRHESQTYIFNKALDEWLNKKGY